MRRRGRRRRDVYDGSARIRQMRFPSRLASVRRLRRERVADVRVNTRVISHVTLYTARVIVTAPVRVTYSLDFGFRFRFDTVIRTGTYYICFDASQYSI